MTVVLYIGQFWGPSVTTEFVLQEEKLGPIYSF